MVRAYLVVPFAVAAKPSHFYSFMRVWTFQFHLSLQVSIENGVKTVVGDLRSAAEAVAIIAIITLARCIWIYILRNGQNKIDAE